MAGTIIDILELVESSPPTITIVLCARYDLAKWSLLDDY